MKSRLQSIAHLIMTTSTRRVAVILLIHVGTILSRTALLLIALACVYQVIACPPLHLVYPVADPAGHNSIYVPGSGFSGFWFHLGFLQALPSIDDHDFYCYSSGCLSVLLAVMNTTLETASDRASLIQSSWKAGNISRYELVDRFVDDFMPSDSLISVMDRLNILVTSTKGGVAIEKASSPSELKGLLLKTTFIPFITGRGFWYADEHGWHVDGGFSRTLHPKCDIELYVPLTLWDISQHTLNPSLDVGQAKQFWLTGQNYRHQVLKTSHTRRDL